MVTEPPALNLSEAMGWAAVLLGDQPGYVNIVSKGDWAGRCFTLGADDDAILQYIWELDKAKREGIYLRVTTMREIPEEGRRGGAADTLSLPGLWADMDRAGPGHAAQGLPETFEEALEIITVARLPMPSTWVDSGGGWYPFWLLETPHVIEGDLEVIQLLSRRWHEALKRGANKLGFTYETGTHDLARVLRLPGTVNRKAGLERPCKVLWEQATGQMFSLEQLALQLDNAIPEEPLPVPVQVPRNLPVLRSSEDISPFDDFERQVDWGDAELLGGAGWEMTWGRVNGERHWVRPGKHRSEGMSATTGRANDRDRLFVFSTSTEFEAQTPYTKGAAYAVLHHRGDFSAAAKALYDQGFGTRHESNSQLEQWQSERYTPPHGQMVAQDAEESQGLGPDFWDSRAYLKHIQVAAHSQQRSAEAVLGAILARVAALTDYRIRIPAIVGAPSSLTVFTVIVASSGVGKTTATEVANQLIPAPQDFHDGLPVGTGEGMAEVFYGMAQVEAWDEKKQQMKTVEERMIVRHNAFFYMDEGQILGQVAKRVGSTLLQTMRSAFSGSTLGATNADAQRRRIVPGNQYQMGLVIGVQQELAGDLIDDVAGGTPQRCQWFSALDESVPDIDDQPSWPGQLAWSAPQRPRVGQVEWLGGGDSNHEPYYMIYDKEIIREVKLADLEKVRGGEAGEPLDSHAYLIRVKTAALLAILDGRFNVDLEDWSLAGRIMANSNARRSAVVGALSAAKERRAQASADAQAVREERIADVREGQLLRKATARIKSVLARAGGTMTAREIGRMLSAPQRECFDAALAELMANGEVTEEVVDREGQPDQGSKTVLRLVP